MANPWIDFLKRFKKDHPEIKQHDLFKKAGEEYKKKSHKQHGGLSALGYSPYQDSKGAGIGTTGVALQLNATNYGGAKRKRTARRKAKHYGGKRRCSAKRNYN
jgi:hypothetical protein